MFMNPFIEAANSHNPLVNPADISVIFAHVSDLIELSTIITRKLEFVSQNWREDESLVGQIFGEHEDDFDVYIRFAINFKASQKAIKRANNNILYRRFIQVGETFLTLLFVCDRKYIHVRFMLTFFFFF